MTLTTQNAREEQVLHRMRMPKAEMLLRAKMEIEKQLLPLLGPERVGALPADVQAEATGFLNRGTVVKE